MRTCKQHCTGISITLQSQKERFTALKVHNNNLNVTFARLTDSVDTHAGGQWRRAPEHETRCTSHKHSMLPSQRALSGTVTAAWEPQELHRYFHMFKRDIEKTRGRTVRLFRSDLAHQWVEVSVTGKGTVWKVPASGAQMRISYAAYKLCVSESGGDVVQGLKCFAKLYRNQPVIVFVCET